jgi:phosphate transport system substrate-binding protein
VTKWNDPRIAAANPNLKLPDLVITVVRRSDSGGTNLVFTKHLSAISEAFAKEVGSGTTVQWPKNDKIVAAPRNDGVTATIKQTPGAIGYIEYGYAKLTKADFALLQNKAGQFILADTKSGQATLATATLDSRLRGWIEDPAGCRCLPDRDGHVAAFLQKAGSQEGGVAAQTGRLLRHHRSKDLRQHGLHPVAGEYYRENQDRVGANPIREDNIAYAPSRR